MAHSILHFAVGVGVGTALYLPRMVRATVEGPVAGIAARWIATAYAAGGLAVLPSILRHAGVPEPFVTGWWMNVFVGFPWLERTVVGGMLMGETLLLLCGAVQYGLLVLAIALRPTLRRGRIRR